jgi:hypothetical protein
MTASGVAVLGLAGCTGDADSGREGAGASASPSPTAASEPDPDRVALDRAVTITTTLLDELTTAALSSDSRDDLDPDGRFTALHTTHLAALDRAAGSSASPTPDSGLPVAVGPRAFRRHELAAQRELAHLAEEAASGALARLLASMSAGIAAHLSAR